MLVIFHNNEKNYMDHDSNLFLFVLFSIFHSIASIATAATEILKVNLPGKAEISCSLHMRKLLKFP